ncbi:MAG: class I SAM-dependent methyltransferase [Nanoarchaeota archaeon]|nr:class I SAM-dependent methyltransferase [Nanoarchaeota archaeon]
MKKSKKEKFGDILNKEMLKFKNQKELKKYYEEKYNRGGYEKGYTLHGVNISNIYHKERQKSALKFLEPKKDEIILDAGCGDGKLTLKISKKCKKIYGADITKNAFKKAKTKAPKNLLFKEMNIENLNFKNKNFDKIVCVETLEHVLHPKKVMKEFYRVLKPKGSLVLTYPTVNTSTITKLEIKTKIGKYFPISEHLTEWDYKELINILKKNKFTLKKSEGIVLDLGKLTKLKLFSKKIMYIITNFQLSVRKFPRNSMFVSLLLEKT